MSITPPPTPPSRQDPANFDTRADAFFAWFVVFVAQVNAAISAMTGYVASAAASAASAVLAPGSNGTSTTSLAIGTGTKTLTIQTGKNFVVGQSVTIASTAAPATDWMHGQITAYNSGTGALTVWVTLTGGSGTLAAWTVGLTGPYQPIATKEEIWAGAATGKIVTPLALRQAQVPTDVTAQLGTAGGVLIDMTAGINHSVTLSSNTTVLSPGSPWPDAIVGRVGRIIIAQDSVGGRTLSWASPWRFAGGAPTLSTAAFAVDLVEYVVLHGGKILCTITKGFTL